MTTYPDTLAIGNAIVAYGTGLHYTNSSPVYTLVTLGEIKDITDQLVTDTACLEVYANTDNSQRKGFGGKVVDEQTWFLLSLVGMNNAQTAEARIYQVRDALVPPLQEHATLGNAGSVFHSQVKPGAGKFFKVFRNGQWLRAHVLELLTRQEWYVPIPPGVTA